MERKLYGVTQFDHGHEHRFIFDEEVLKQNVYGGEPLPDSDTVDAGFPFGGSDSSAVSFRYLPDLEEAKSFLTAPAQGPDSDDPMLVDIAEYYLTVSDGHGSCTQEVCDQLGLDIDELKQDDTSDHMRLHALEMMRDLTVLPGFTAENLFYGDDREMRWSELCELHKSVVEDVPAKATSLTEKAAEAYETYGAGRSAEDEHDHDLGASLEEKAAEAYEAVKSHCHEDI